jgi:heme exporter protein CcmD
MNPKYAVFIWGSYGLTLAVLAWNLIVPRLRRSDLRRRFAAGDEAEAEDE